MPVANVLGFPHAYDLTEPAAGSAIAPGDALVSLHGWLLSRAYWQPLIERLSGQYRCLAYDLRGFGESVQRGGHPADAPIRQVALPLGRAVGAATAPSGGGVAVAESYTAPAYSLAAYAQDLSYLLDELGLDRVWLLGHSLGGSVALWAAYLLPERVKGVICINAGGGIYIPKEFAKFRSAGQQMVKFRPAWLPEVPLLPRVFARVMVRQPLALRWGQQRLQDFVRADGSAAEGALLASTTREEVHLLPWLIGQLSQPVHFITASQDRVMPPRYVRYLASFHPQFQRGEMVSELSDCGHMAMVEQANAVAEIVRSVLESELRVQATGHTGWQCR